MALQYPPTKNPAVIWANQAIAVHPDNPVHGMTGGRLPVALPAAHVKVAHTVKALALERVNITLHPPHPGIRSRRRPSTKPKARAAIIANRRPTITVVVWCQ